ncbi:MAG: TonB family protein [Lysobacter sp.]|nr:TonB family protein [Lysobacter sp.]
MTRQLWIALVLMLFVGTATAGGPEEVRKQIESTMLLTGTIDLDAAGRVERYTLDHRKKLSEPVVRLLARSVPQWRFEPVLVKGQATAARSHMSLRLVASKLDDGDYNLQIHGAQFHPSPSDTSTARHRLTPPAYPKPAARAGAGGTVYVVLKVTPDGRIEDAAVEQVNLRIVTSEHLMAGWRKMLSKAALRATKTWMVTTPAGELDKPYWSARVPVEFIAPNQRSAQDDERDQEWHAYVPGPRQPIPWMPDSIGSSAADALGAGGVYPVDAGLRLLTVLDEN